EQEKIDWSRPSEEIINLVRALNPRPVAWTTYKGKRIKIYTLRLCNKDFDGRYGTVVECGKKSLAVMCGDGRAVNVIELQAENSKKTDIASYLCGRKFQVGDILGE
ncbi:MAG: methionyl-tRNA formyltransferase, partial [Clostridia bacterium]|nr:methionyl-tRNA formyltransferase [Clostridia bacterium]